ncbi:MAG: hypothetical protein DI533_20050 [Cereibacter sphaeroides]|uniref:Uncharacterized protein n=1 Tax=Cereibacter sphaeroides TaxID=1063 RepID=A0A2W5S7V4_CERSP|nr:MAG: hypothetical protein DI533_20050 [Cereibacter sphaeroides]
MSCVRLDYTDMRRGHGTVMEVMEERRWGAVVWQVWCDCGRIYEADSQNLKKRNDFACRPCIRAGQTHAIKHALARRGAVHPLYSTWENMRRRCNDPAATSFKYYGARGIKACKAWNESFETFLADILRSIGERPEGKTLDRPDNDGNYEPGNVRWATRTEQNINKRKVD